jgi:hypothetical protein
MMPKPQKTGSRSRQQRQKEAKRLARERRIKQYGGDNFRRYQAVVTALKQLYPTEPHGNLARHLKTLAWLISGIVGSQRTNYRAIAKKGPDGTKVESRIKRYGRWVNNDRVDIETYFTPYAIGLLVSLANRPLALVIDGSVVGQGCQALVISVVYGRRALPLGWLVVQAAKGHLPEESHLALVAQVKTLIPPEATVIFLGDGEFDGVRLQAQVDRYGWQYVCRTAKDIILAEAEEEFSGQELGLRPGQFIAIPEVTFTRARYGPVQVIAWWAKDQAQPLFLVTNMELAQEACWWYKKRFRIETFFSDQKSRGFQLHKSHLDDPERLATLMIAACLAYIWMVYLGAYAKHTGWDKIIHRTDRCDLSLFQLGLDLLEHFLNEGIPIPVAFQLSAHLNGIPQPLPDEV